MLGFLPAQARLELLRNRINFFSHIGKPFQTAWQSVNNLATSLGTHLNRLYQTWSRPEYKYPSLLSVGVGASLYLSGFGWLPLAWSVTGSLIGGHFGIRATQELLALYNEVRLTVREARRTMRTANQTFATVNARAIQAKAIVSRANKLLIRADETLSDVNGIVTDADATLTRANEQVVPLVEKTLKNVNATTEYINGGAQTTSTFATPITYMASGFRAVGGLFRNEPSIEKADALEYNAEQNDGSEPLRMSNV